jgi:hypothetical protein
MSIAYHPGLAPTFLWQPPKRSWLGIIWAAIMAEPEPKPVFNRRAIQTASPPIDYAPEPKREPEPDLAQLANDLIVIPPDPITEVKRLIRSFNHGQMRAYCEAHGVGTLEGMDKVWEWANETA